jgi:hypothetical protein
MSDLGTVAWLARSNGRLTLRDRAALIVGLFGALAEGVRLRRWARRSGRRELPLDTFQPPDTPMVNAARGEMLAHASAPMAAHCFRTAYWGLFVLNQHTELTPELLEIAWVAALLHDIGLERPVPHGDFSSGGIAVLHELTRAQAWPEQRVHYAAEAIATNLSARVDRERSGIVAWALNVGGLGELGFRPHRAQIHPARVAELEQRYPRTGFRTTAMALIADEARRVPGSRFGFFRWMFPIIMAR